MNANIYDEGGNRIQDNKSVETGHQDTMSPTAEHSGSDGSSPAPPFTSFFYEAIFLGIICIAQLTTQVALGQTLNLVHVIGNHFGLSNPGQLSWLIAGYSLTVGTFILIAGRLGDLFGYKKILLYGFAWFSLWTLVAGLSCYSNHVLFVFARVLQGNNLFGLQMRH